MRLGDRRDIHSLMDAAFTLNKGDTVSRGHRLFVPLAMVQRVPPLAPPLLL